ncbi:GNAT family acetyltransferase [Rhizobium sp. Root149]|uniref:GNAT superfamily N-acetyltransferase n=1 Tax=Rhizobium rhizoryzae TaxID=451876 RepID=A0A7W6LIC0_9HYPH|nr:MULTISPECIES: GNAT family N-acetyltransferase [Rhizobium]KQZ50522.1 GNAT family acetyltransferase [Rhizobium sp. Root149]MBB4143561.1 GNAT superfamily N-acetyltransferase [Rhizobium rhizoryzae]
MGILIRNATAGDEARFRELWASYLDFYQVTVSDEITASTFSKALSPDSSIFMQVAEVDGRVEGFALCLTHEGTWILGKDLYLEDLFVDASQRGKGVGRALLQDLVDLSKANGWSRLYWHTAETNVTARKLYDSFVQSDGHIRYRITIG